MNPVIYLSFRGVGDPGAPDHITYIDLPAFVANDQPGVAIIGAGTSFTVPYPNRDIDVEVHGSLADAMSAIGEMVRKAAERDWLLTDLRWAVS